MFPRRFVGKLYFVTMRVWGGLHVSLVDLELDLGLGFAVGVHCCPLWGDAVWNIGWRVGREGSRLTVSGYACNNCADCSR